MQSKRVEKPLLYVYERRLYTRGTCSNCNSSLPHPDNICIRNLILLIELVLGVVLVLQSPWNLHHCIISCSVKLFLQRSKPRRKKKKKTLLKLIFDVPLLQYLRNLSPSSGLSGPMEKPITLLSNDSTTDLTPAIYRINCKLPHNHLHNIE